MDPVLGQALITLIYFIAEIAKQQGMSKDQATEYIQKNFADSWKKIEDRPASELPDA